MKTLFIFLVTLVSITTVSAQKRSYNDPYDRNDHNQTRAIAIDNDRYSRSNDYAYNSQRDNRDNRYKEIQRQQQIEKLNRDYDKRIRDYRNDRSINQRERERRIAQMERERGQKIKSFTGGVVVGALAGVLLGVLIGGK